MNYYLVDCETRVYPDNASFRNLHEDLRPHALSKLTALCRAEFDANHTSNWNNKPKNALDIAALIDNVDTDYLTNDLAGDLGTSVSFSDTSEEYWVEVSSDVHIIDRRILHGIAPGSLVRSVDVKNDDGSIVTVSGSVNITVISTKIT